MQINRRQFMRLGAQAAAVAAASRFSVAEAFAQSTSVDAPGRAPLDAYVERYMRAMGAPGMILATADRGGTRRIANYGFDDVEHAKAIAEGTLFQIGSISKSFVAICLLQLRDEGRLDLHKPIRDYLPWLRIESAFAPITTHHLLSHTAGLPDGPLFPSDPQAGLRAAHAPGQRFHYCNAAFEALGHLLWTLDGRPQADVLRLRVFGPLGMANTEPQIGFDLADRMAKSYWAWLGDRPYPRRGRLAEAPGIVSSSGAGCIASTAADMARYVRMLADGGNGPNGRLLSKEAFALFASAHAKAAEFGPTAHYGYGIVVDKAEGHTVLRHTGGMVSFASAVHVDIDAGVGAFASINAMQGYRPTAVVDYAARLMRAPGEGAGRPEPPPIDDPSVLPNAADYAGVYRSPDGRRLEFVADGGHLYLIHHGDRVAIESSGDVALVMHRDFSRLPLVFGRADAKDPKSAVVEAGWGGDWYAHARYRGPTTFTVPPEWEAHVGHYRNDDPWIGSLRVVIRKGVLMLDGLTPLAAGTDGVFHLRDEEDSPEWVSFHDVVNGRSMRMTFSGADLRREMAA